MQHFSFPFGDPVFPLGDWHVSVQIITFENTYGLDAARSRVEETTDGWRVRADRLMWAGGQESADGGATLAAARLADGDGVALSVHAEHAETIRCTKVILTGLPEATLLARRWDEETIPDAGVLYQYPGYTKFGSQSTIQTPLIFLKLVSGDGYLAIRSLDADVRCKRIAAYRHEGALTLELIHEEAAARMTTRVDVPAWRIERTNDPAAVVRAHAAHLAEAHGLARWEEREDVPAWARDIAMVAAIHGMHWSGYIFNTYDQMLDMLRWITERIEGRRVLAYLPGWEGRYYWQYGDYRPEPRLGGVDGFRRLVAGAHALGVHLMPMFGANSANTGLPNFEQWGEPARMRSAGGHIEQGNKPDWDVSRAHDPGWQAILNPGAPTWRNRLVRQVRALVTEYDLAGDAVFFDTSHWWQNDPVHPVYDGLRALKDELRAGMPRLMVTGEGWYDALGAITPVSHSHVPSRWIDEIFTPANRTFDHLSAGDPSRGSTGVHERGTEPFRLGPLARHHWPTVTLVNGSIARAPERVEWVIAQARQYAEHFLGDSLHRDE